MYAGDLLLAPGEHMWIHVSLATRRACDPAPDVADQLGKLAAAHAQLPRPRRQVAAVGKR